MNIDSIFDREKEIKKLLLKSSNKHVLHFYDSLTKNEKSSLLSSLEKIDLEKIKNYVDDFSIKTLSTPENSYCPAEYLSYSNRTEKQYNIGIEALKNGEVGFLTVAGGQASRLGFEKPKGTFGISPVNNNSLFQIFAEKILFYTRHYSHSFEWFIMTSVDNYKDTKTFFEDNNFFGLSKEQVYFFPQGMLPSITEKGKLILKNKSSLFLNPDGHGGILTALNSSGLTDLMIDKNIKYLSYFQVDNPVVLMADPYFIGYHIESSSQVTTKVIKKAYPDEKLGTIVHGTKNKTNLIIEYSDMTPEMTNATKSDGSLQYQMGSIGIHIFNVDFIKDTTRKLPIHCAKKQIDGYDFSKNPPVINSIQAIKFETFVFDIIPFASHSAFFETQRTEEFFPLKNATGVDSIETTRQGQISLYKSWLIDNNIAIPKNFILEISPLLAPDRAVFNNIVNSQKADIINKIAKGESDEGKIFIH